MLNLPVDQSQGVSVDPEDIADIEGKLGDWWWRITSGKLYRIKVKTSDDPDDPGLEKPFKPNVSQLALISGMHNRNVILKARQLGFSTLVQIMCLDQCLWNPDQEALLIAQGTKEAEEIYRSKLKYAYDRLPPWLKSRMPLEKDTQSHIIFEHNESSIQVRTSGRSGTFHFLHISEFGKIAAKFPEKADEINSGTMQALPLDAMVFVESTAEGQEGAFYELARRAEAKARAHKILNAQEYKFHFFPWWQNPEYRIADYGSVIISMKDHEYFDKVEDKMGCTLDMEQRAFYVAKRDEEFAHKPSLMWREYPSTPDECWKSSTEGKILIHQVNAARAQGRIGKVPHRPGLPVNGFWDIGASDDNVCWLHQFVHGNDHWIGYKEAAGEGFLPFIRWIEGLGYEIGTMWLPHDASNLVNGVEQPTSMLSQLRLLKPSWNWQVVPRVTTLQHGIDLLRLDFSTYYFDEKACKEGIAHLENYKRQWLTSLNVWGPDPAHDEHCHAADAIRQKAQAYEDVARQGQGKKPGKRRPATSGWAA